MSDTIEDRQKVVDRLRYWKKQHKVAIHNGSEKGVMAGTHYPIVVLANGACICIAEAGEHIRGTKQQAHLFPASSFQLSLF